jgi:hypothetical protein
MSNFICLKHLKFCSLCLLPELLKICRKLHFPAYFLQISLFSVYFASLIEKTKNLILLWTKICLKTQQSAPVNGNATPNPVQPNPANMANMANMANQPGQTPTQPKTGFGASAGNFH